MRHNHSTGGAAFNREIVHESTNAGNATAETVRGAETAATRAFDIRNSRAAVTTLDAHTTPIRFIDLGQQNGAGSRVAQEIGCQLRDGEGDGFALDRPETNRMGQGSPPAPSLLDIDRFINREA
jgi:hypothetical protein